MAQAPAAAAAEPFPPPAQLPLAAGPLTPADASQTYDQAFFARYNLTNAEDMLRRIPGGSAILDSVGTLGQARGLGAGGDQILIDGKRLASKSTDVAATLRRIPASSVLRVELIRGTSGNIEVLSEGLVVNIVMKEGATATKGQGNFEINQRFDNMGWRDVDGLISYSNTLGRLSFTLGAEKNLWTPLATSPTGGGSDWTERTRLETYYYPNGQVQQIRPQAWNREHHKKIFTAQFGYTFENADELHLNFLYQPHPIKMIDVTPYTSFSATGAQIPGVTREYHQQNSKRNVLEIGGEYERKVWNGSFNLIAIHNRLETPSRDFRNRTAPSGAITEVSRNETDQTTGEDVVRASYNWPVFAGQTLTLGAEGAKNFLDQDQQGYFDLNRDGKQDALPITHALVKELRGETFAIHNWKINAKTTLESSLSYEASRISTNYPQIPVTTYKFLKPRFDFRYNATPQDRLRVKVERTISQLNFQNFVPIYNAVDDRIDAGNPAIAPEKTWNYETGFEHRLARDQGQVEVRGFYKDISDHIDRGPFGLPSNGLPSSAPVNIQSAKQYGVEFKAGVRLAKLGLPNAQIDTRYLRQSSSVKDPFTGRDRAILGTYKSEFTLTFRHDLTALRASYGGTLYATTGEQVTSDIRTLQYFKRDPRLQLFVEKALRDNLTLRFEAYNLTGSHEFSRRTLYTFSQANAAINRTETYEETRDRRFAIRLRGKF